MDIRIKLNPDLLNFDVDFIDNDLEIDEGLESSILISLFSDRRVTFEEIPDNQSDLRGWWGDAVDLTEDNKIGSKLWILLREKQTDETLARAKEYCEEALQWILDDGVAKSVTVTTAYPERGHLRISIDVEKPDGDKVKYAYNFIWEGQENAI